MTAAISVYTTPWCGYCRILKRNLDAADIAYDEIDIEQVEGAAAIVAQINGGNQTIPTVVFADGTALTNPSLREVQQQLGGQ